MSKQTFINIDPVVDSSQFDFQDFPKFKDSSVPKTEKLPAYNDDIPKLNIWSMDYFKTFFDVNTDMVVDRVIASMYPKRGINYLESYIRLKPDLYGPFWICITLIFSIAISGNMANYLQAAARQENYHWKYDFHAVSITATTIFLYAWFVPLILWLVLKYRGETGAVQLTLLELTCVYGYSLSVYVPISMLWVIQVNIIQWALLFVGASLSGYVLMTSIGPAFGEKSYILAFMFLLLHVLLAGGFMLYFFHVPPIVSEKKSIHTS